MVYNRETVKQNRLSITTTDIVNDETITKFDLLSLGFIGLFIFKYVICISIFFLYVGLIKPDYLASFILARDKRICLGFMDQQFCQDFKFTFVKQISEYTFCVIMRIR